MSTDFHFCYSLLKKFQGALIAAQQVKNPTNIHEDAGLIPGSTQWVKDPRIATSCSRDHRLGWDLALPRVSYRPAAAALIQPLAWEFPYATHAALKKLFYLQEWSICLV